MYKLVVIDDETVIRKGISVIAEQSGLSLSVVGEAVDGESGLALLLCCEPDFAVVDVKMPKLNGLQMIRRYLDESSVRRTRFIILSAYEDFAYTRQAIQAGVCDYLLKPVNRFEMIHLLSSLIGDAKQPVWLDQAPATSPLDIAVLYIQQHFYQLISLPDVAEIAGLSPNYLASQLKRSTGKSYLAYLTGLRVEKAKALLSRSRLRIGEVAASVGYADPKHFTKVFHKITGMSPGQYRAVQQAKNGETDT